MCGDAGPYTPSAEVLAEWREEALDARVSWERRHDPLIGDRRVRPLVHVPDGEGGVPAAHRRAAQGPHLLEAFTIDGWTLVGVADAEGQAVSWLVEADATPDRAS